MAHSSADYEYEERGSGPPILFIPGSFGTGSGWKPTIGHLGNGYRVITTSLFGYGATADIRPDGNGTMSQQTALIDAIIERIGTSPHIVAHSFGGLAALAHTLSGQHAPASLLLIEANPLGLLRALGDLEHYGMFTTMTVQYFAEFACGKPEAARHVIDFYGGPDTFDRMPLKVRDYIIATTAANVKDWSSGTPFEPDAETLQSIRIPTTVVRGGDGHPAMLKIAERLHQFIPGAQLITIDGGSHFLPSTHPTEIAALIRQHVSGTYSEPVSWGVNSDQWHL